MGRALPLTLQLARQYPNLRIVGIHLTGNDEPERVEYSLQKVISYFNLPYPVIMDDGDATFRAYGVSGTPHWVLLNPDGTIRKHFFGSMEGAQQRLFYALAEISSRRCHSLVWRTYRAMPRPGRPHHHRHHFCR